LKKQKTAYIFECDSAWIEALQQTFEPWKEKVIIADKYVSDVTDSHNISLNDFFKDKQIDFIKADIEGAEVKMLQGASEILKRNNLKILACAYHKPNDAKDIKVILENYGFTAEYSKGYMIIFSKGFLFPKPNLRKGLIRAAKN